MAYWLIKSEPAKWSWDQQLAAGADGTFWNGVRNYSARLSLLAMQLGEQAFFYHSNEGKAVVGIVEIIRLYYPDPSDESGRFGMVDVAAQVSLPQPVPLETIKATESLAKMVLVTNSRLSVQAVTPAEWEIICRMGGMV